jgi:hypothetical protein
MANNVFANNDEIACKAGSGKSICCFPDVCMTPPENPATPPGVPVPYPNTGMSSDTADGSRTVTISDQEVMLKNKSYFKQSTGDEAGCAAKKGVVTGVNRGKVYFVSWSMNVKIEGENVDRHIDQTTHNHGSGPNTGPWAYVDMAAIASLPGCYDNMREIHRKCQPWRDGRGCPEEHITRIEEAEAFRDGSPKNSAARAAAQLRVRERYLEYTREIRKDPCRHAMCCLLMPFDDLEKVKCPKQTGEHMIEKSSFGGYSNYQMGRAPTSFTEGPSYHLGEHGVLSLDRKEAIDNWRTEHPNGTWTMQNAAELGARGHCEQNGHCNEDCITNQLIAGHQTMGINPTDPIDQNPSASDRSTNDREILRLVQESLADERSAGFR